MTDQSLARDTSDNAGLWFSGIAGLLVALLISSLVERPVPWSAGLYYWLGWPLMCTVVALVTWRYPVRAWRWVMTMAVGQVFAVILSGAGNMAPVALIYAILLSVPQFTVASLVSARRLAASRRNDPSDEDR